MTERRVRQLEQDQKVPLSYIGKVGGIPVHNGGHVLGECVGNASSDGMKLKSILFAEKGAFVSFYEMKALSDSAKKDANKMKTKSNRRGRRQRGYRGLLWVLAAGLLLFGLIAQQDILLGTSSRHALLMDARTGQVLARKRSGEEAAPASLTKMMTVLLATEALPDLDTPVTLPEDIFPALYKADASMAGFQPGETVTVRDLLYGAMLPSGAECCEALARQVSGSEEAFVALMNRKAGELGMKHTHFANCTGLTSPEHYSSAADLAVLLQAAMMLLIINAIFGIVYGAYTLFWMPETLPRYYDENHVCNFAQGAIHMHIPGVYYNNRNWLHVIKAMRVWCVVSMLLTPLCTAAAVVFEQATGWQMWRAVLIGYIASLFGAIVIPAKKYQ